MNPRILTVDDSVTAKRIAATIVISRPGWTVCGEAEDGLSGIQKVQEPKPDLVLLDFGMPGIHGIETARGCLQRIRRCRLSYSPYGR
jgi:chemotaxis response regulator CheB